MVWSRPKLWELLKHDRVHEDLGESVNFNNKIRKRTLIEASRICESMSRGYKDDASNYVYGCEEVLRAHFESCEKAAMECSNRLREIANEIDCTVEKKRNG